ncbi:hypothetical protein Tdes44962_MAKER03235 [Teratosphaeria destructans]|uniref:Uncharacterized protein n=1 Tax=Teratosphaeria destructans TaxID=418781 RepID=A0A9W7SQF1_9PEZI|nr:hypothetical protein Tdes44962_MAKER03235 [Teratosphaeria destructans]
MSGTGEGQGIYDTVRQTAASAAATASQYASSLTGQTSSGASTLPVRDSTPVAGAAAAAGVPETVAVSDRKAGWAPEAAANPEAVREKSAMEAELKRTVPKEGLANTPAASNDPVGLDGAAGDKSHSIDDSQHGVGAVAGLTGANAATTMEVPNGKISSEPYPYTMPVSSAKPEPGVDSSTTKTAGSSGSESVGNYSYAQGGDDRLHPSGTEHSSTAARGSMAPTEGVMDVRNDRDPVGGHREIGKGAMRGAGDSTAKRDVTSDTGDAPGDVKRNLKEIDDSTPSERDDVSKETSAPKSNKPVSDHEAATRTNQDAIPTAGGKKVGEGHFGESSQVPDVLPKREGDAGSKITNNAQDSATRPELDANENASSSGSGSKLGNVLHKVEDKLHLGGKKS